MKIVLTGGGSGGHFYPLIAVAEAIQKEVIERKLIPVELFYMAPVPYNDSLLFDTHIKFIKVPGGKMRRYSDIRNYFDAIFTAWGVVISIFKLFSIYPDVIFSKGGGVSIPVVLAARILKIPVFIHESDSVPGRANMYASKFASRIAVSFSEAAQYFKKKEGVVVHTGHPIRSELTSPQKTGAMEFLHLENDIPTIFLIGGSLGSVLLNDALLESLPILLNNYQVIHQTGKANYNDVKIRTDFILANHPHKNRYKIFDYLNTLGLRMAAGACDLVITRGGSSVFEVGSWGVPAIVVPITDSNGDHQRKNAYAFARAGAGIVIEEANLTGHILTSEIDRILHDPLIRAKMGQSGKKFAMPDAAGTIAHELLQIALSHEA